MHQLINAKADINDSDDNGDTGLHWACKKGYHTMILELHRAKANINKTNNKGWTPLHIACHENSMECARNLINCKGSLDNFETDNLTPSLTADKERFTKIIDHLCDI